MLSVELKQKLETLPTQAGCYVMKDKAGEVVYVGKAVNLRARVGQYFQERSSDTRAFIPFLEDLLGEVEVMITPSEKDAVLLADELTSQLEGRMKDAAGKLEYERAAQLRDQLHAIERSLEKQRTVLGDLLDQDVLGYHREGPALEIHLLFFRNGRLTGGRSFGF